MSEAIERPGEEWATDAERVDGYLARADGIPHRTEGEAALLDEVSPDRRRLLDLGTGDGRMMALLLVPCPEAEGVAVDFSPTMLARARDRFEGDDGAVWSSTTWRAAPLSRPARSSARASRSTTFRTIASGVSRRGLGDPGARRDLLQPRPRVLPTPALHQVPGRPGGGTRTRRTFSSTSRPSSPGFGRSASRTWTACGSGASSRFSRASARRSRFRARGESPANPRQPQKPARSRGFLRFRWQRRGFAVRGVVRAATAVREAPALAAAFCGMRGPWGPA